MKYTLLSKWTVLILTLVTAGLILGGVKLAFGGGNIGAGILLLLVGVLVYAIAWVVALFDSIQERRFGWSVGLIVLVPFLIGPALYGLVGPHNTKEPGSITPSPRKRAAPRDIMWMRHRAGGCDLDRPHEFAILYAVKLRRTGVAAAEGAPASTAPAKAR